MAPTTNTIGANAERARSHNRQMVLERVRQAGLIGRAEIARGSGLSTQAVSNIISDLLADGLIAEKGRKATTRGQPPVQYGLNPCGGYAVGIEIRTDAVLSAVVDLSGQTSASARYPLGPQTLEGVTAAVVSAKDAIIAEADVAIEKVLGAGIVMPGPFGPTGLSGTESELSVFEDIWPETWFSDALDLPVVVENDANAAAVAERLTGIATELETFAFLYFGTGLGLGIIQNGRLVPGAFGNAGEIGHIPIQAGSGHVPLEELLSRMSAQRHLAQHGLAIDTVQALADAYDQGAAPLAEWLENARRPFSTAIAIVENILDPEAVIIGGAMPDTILDHLISHADLPERSVSNRPSRAVPRVLRGASGRLTGTLGAASLAINSAFTPRIAAGL